MSKEEMVRTVFCQAKSGNYIAHQDHVTCEVCTPAAANKAAEEGGLPVCSVKGAENMPLCVGGCAKRGVCNERAAADHASRQVANNAEVEPVAYLTSDKRILVFADRVTGNDHGMTALYATPPATTGASTVLTDERISEIASAVPCKFWHAEWFTLFARAIEREVAAKAGQVAVPEWEPIETAPKTGRTLLLGCFNEMGNWRTMRGQWFTKADIDQDWEETDGFEAGWYETVVEPDFPNCWEISPTHWMELPAAPSPAKDSK